MQNYFHVDPNFSIVFNLNPPQGAEFGPILHLIHPWGLGTEFSPCLHLNPLWVQLD